MRGASTRPRLSALEVDAAVSDAIAKVSFCLLY